MTTSKKLFLLRHGIAVEPGRSGYEESERPLTPEGISEMRSVAKGMKTLGLDFDLILSSPYVRARQTAEIAAKELKLTKKLEFTEALISGREPRFLLQELEAKYARNESILLVGHEPFLSQLISILISSRKDCLVQFKKAGLCKLNVQSLQSPHPAAVLKWLLTPKQMTLIGRA